MRELKEIKFSKSKKVRGKALSLLVITCIISLFMVGGCGKEDQKEVLKVLNYGAYIDKSLLDDFEDDNNCRIVYDTYTSPEDMYIKFESGASDYDVIITGEYMIERLKNEGKLQKLNFENIPNYQYIGDDFRNKQYDPDNEYSVPYFWGTVGILYNKNTVDVSSGSWGILWDEKYAGKIIMMDSQRDTFAAALGYLGYSINTTDEGELDEALDLLIDQKKYVMAYVVDAAKDMMIGGEADVALCWSGGATGAMLDEIGGEDFGFLIPKEGSNIWVDAMCIPENAANKVLGENFINYLTSTEATLKDIDEVMYSTVQTQALSQLPDELKNNNAFNPSKEEMAKLEMFRDLKENIYLYNDRWTELMGTD